MMEFFHLFLRINEIEHVFIACIILSSFLKMPGLPFLLFLYDGLISPFSGNGLFTVVFVFICEFYVCYICMLF